MITKKIKEWKIHPSISVKEKGQKLSSEYTDKSQWIDVSVPSTVLGALVKSGLYKDIYKDKNLLDIDTNQFKTSWLYFSEFDLKPLELDYTAILSFKGINYRANIWLNGTLIADKSQIFGTYRHWNFQIEEYLKEKNNKLAVEIFPPEKGDFSIGFVDWNPGPPDKNMGLFRDVSLEFNKGISISSPCVTSHLNTPDYSQAELTVAAILQNHSSESIMGLLKASIGSISLSKQMNLDPHQSIDVDFTSDDYKDLIIENPKLWQPNNVGDPHLYRLELEFYINDALSDSTVTNFGIRSVSDYLTDEGHRGYIINGKKLLIKGAGWTDDLLLEDTYDSIETQVRYARDMNLNCIRLEGFWGKDQTIYDLCDQYGMLVMVGWSCHWEHECHMGVPVDPLYGAVSTPEAIELIAESWKDQLLSIRHHPSIFVWTVASDMVPHPDLERRYIEIFKKWDSSRPYLNSTGGVGSEQSIITNAVIESTISGSSGVKMLGPYDHTPPVYWYTNTNLGGAYGFNTETCPGANVPPLDSLKKMFSSELLWPINDTWNFHCGLYEFASISRFKEALDERYGVSNTIKEFAMKSQVMNYELMRPMFEAFQNNKGKSTGIIQWMLNSAFPSLYWQLFDSYLMPNGAYYGVKKACEPLHLLYNYGSNQVILINDFDKRQQVDIQIRIFDINSKEIFYQKTQSISEPDSSFPVLEIPGNLPLSSVYFLDLRLLDKNEEISSNFYWLSQQKDVLDYEAVVGDFGFYTPSKEHADYTELMSLPFPQIDSTLTINDLEDEQIYQITLKNTSNKIAFFLVLDLINTEVDNPILPVFWSENYFSLLPHEIKSVSARVKRRDVPSKSTELRIKGWNKDEKN
ncbi:glycoside hydrolase family 2 protein [Oceanispirochaeta crateris]|nr:glycoside hydrolase family 2 TIM barrel-domain containing protein [Oceanispirochaeta crateris]